MEMVNFLCGNFNNICYLYAIKNDQSDWRYFAERDSDVDVHFSLPTSLKDQISRLKTNTVKSIALTLTEEQLHNYVNEGKFVFKGKELNTFIQLSGKTTNRRSIERAKSKSTHDITFEVGKTNPATFLRDFEKCCDVKTDKDKLYKLRNDKPQFSTLFFKDDWVTARATFLKLYSTQFAENMVKDLRFSFEDEPSLLSFVERKMNALSAYTSLPLENQLEIILSELPIQIANVFIAQDKLNRTKAEMLEFCELLQEYCDYSENTETTSLPTSPDIPRNVVQDLEISDFQEEIDSDTSSTSTNSSGSRIARKRRRSGCPVDILRIIAEESESNTDSESNRNDDY
ncbi:hypothetical protein Bhyg_02979 [Pseudolycoriella hygida]|uniref:Uncharacterized protein n=1 Tax=Pseudolycoriella hygida TaxID=35572 RepID=A0A9Q0NCG4_9DIPT|nr:hypothetical protein Bhyg_02979 [Pseudolycoriella hygida]